MLNIPKIREKSKHILRIITRQDIYIGLIIVCIGLSSYGLGVISAQKENQQELKIYDLYPELQAAWQEKGSAPASTATSVAEGKYVASKNGTKYHFPWCGSAQRIKEENKVWFSTAEEAEQAGYGPAANCPGL